MDKITTLEHMQAAAEAARQTIGAVAKAAADALSEMEDVKADKPSRVSVTIPTTGWSKSNSGAYPCSYDITAKTVTASDRANIVIATDSMAIAMACGMCPTCETLAGKIRIRAASVPSAPIEAEYWIDVGKEL